MPANFLYATATGMSGILTISTNDNHGAATAMATVSCESISGIDIGDAVSIDLGYTDDHGTVFTGYVKNIDRNVPNNTYEVTCMDRMVRAVDFFVAPADPNNPPSFENISAEDLVGEAFALAGLDDNYSYDTTNFYFGVAGVKAEIKLTTVYDYCKGIADMLAYAIWCEGSTVYFKDRKPYYTSGSKIATITDSLIISGSYRRSEKDLRNRIVCYGAGDIHAEASASSPYLPNGFYKSVVYSHPMIDSQEMAQDTCDYNLERLNRLTKSVALTTLGNHDYKARRNVTLTSSYFPNDDFYIYGCEHNWSQAGYTCNLDLRF